ncbi:hypothetical protein TW95_gp1711 [Pandoravirus inopinatum]|uniref:Uncharacterized protein n=1 Tax=Pandoravirus inopinatum TaxID=1605721 RepID=A0A0B5J902_9VIRU|nr:hypothetical protein TW95_gp1711 [Pandoravirus inopinatum]AJF98445.1 hypothetical protein [Pandoravirus inopinatum]
MRRCCRLSLKVVGVGESSLGPSEGERARACLGGDPLSPVTQSREARQTGQHGGPWGMHSALVRHQKKGDRATVAAGAMVHEKGIGPVFGLASAQKAPPEKAGQHNRRGRRLLLELRRPSVVVACAPSPIWIL